jgi:hypothetical protein
MALLAIAGQRFYIGKVMNDQASDFVASDFTTLHASPDAWIEVDGWETMGTIGDAVTDIATILINRGRTIHQKGSADAPPMSNTFATIADDPGQLALIAAGAPSVKDNYAFRIKGNETGTPSETYFIGLVMGTPDPGGSANSVRKLNANIQINSNIVLVPAS